MEQIQLQQGQIVKQTNQFLFTPWLIQNFYKSILKPEEQFQQLYEVINQIISKYQESLPIKKQTTENLNPPQEIQNIRNQRQPNNIQNTYIDQQQQQQQQPQQLQQQTPPNLQKQNSLQNQQTIETQQNQKEQQQYQQNNAKIQNNNINNQKLQSNELNVVKQEEEINETSNIKTEKQTKSKKPRQSKKAKEEQKNQQKEKEDEDQQQKKLKIKQEQDQEELKKIENSNLQEEVKQKQQQKIDEVPQQPQIEIQKSMPKIKKEETNEIQNNIKNEDEESSIQQSQKTEIKSKKKIDKELKGKEYHGRIYTPDDEIKQFDKQLNIMCAENIKKRILNLQKAYKAKNKLIREEDLKQVIYNIKKSLNNHFLSFMKNLSYEIVQNTYYEYNGEEFIIFEEKKKDQIKDIYNPFQGQLDKQDPSLNQKRKKYEKEDSQIIFKKCKGENNLEIRKLIEKHDMDQEAKYLKALKEGKFFPQYKEKLEKKGRSTDAMTDIKNIIAYELNQKDDKKSGAQPQVWGDKPMGKNKIVNQKNKDTYYVPKQINPDSIISTLEKRKDLPSQKVLQKMFIFS